MYFLAIKNPKALVKTGLVSFSSQTPLAYYSLKMTGRKKKQLSCSVLQCMSFVTLLGFGKDPFTSGTRVFRTS